jgi:hypothetical protein
MEPVTREDGWVALQHYTSNPAVVMIESDKTTYSFSPKYNVSLAWVRPEHVAQLLQVKARMCCGRQANKFVYASPSNVSIWQTGHR